MSHLYSYIVMIVVLVVLAVFTDQPGGAGYLAVLILISALSFLVVFNPWRKDLFEAIKVAAGFYGLSFGIGPLILGPMGAFELWYYGSDIDHVLFTGASIALAGLLAMLSGYYICPRYAWAVPAIVDERQSAHAPSFRWWLRASANLLLLVGLASYAALVLQSGGISHFLHYEGARAEIFQGAYGGLFWGTLFLISGFSVHAALSVARRPVLVMTGAIAVGALFALFQGRARAIIPVIAGLVILHYAYQRISVRNVLVFAAALFVFASIFGVYRGADKSEVAASPGSFLSSYFEETSENTFKTLGADIERLDVLLVAYRYLEKGNPPRGGEAMLGWLGPIDRRFFGGQFELRSSGQFLNGLINPHLRGVRTGAQPSLPGELCLSFGVFGVIFGMLAYGILLKFLANVINRVEISATRIALYAYPMVTFSMVVISGTHVLFHIIVVGAGVFAAWVTAALFGGSATRLGHGIRANP